MTPGDICLVHFPFTDGSATKLRPVLVVSAAQFNQGQDVVVLPISSRPGSDDPFTVFVGPQRYQSAGLKAPSSIKYSKPMTIAKVVVKRRLGKLPSDLLGEVLKKLGTVFSVA